MTFENLATFYPEQVSEPHGIPVLRGVEAIEGVLLPFNYAMGEKNRAGKIVHFFLDDAQFVRVWNAPDKYIDLLRGFRAVMTPDFSTYTGMPKALQLYNHYRKHWCGAYWEKLQMKVIQTISWSDESSFEWCFEGEATGRAVAISSVGTQNAPEARRLFLAGFEAMMERLHPSQVLCYGKAPAEIAGMVEEYPAWQIRRKEV